MKEIIEKLEELISETRQLSIQIAQLGDKHEDEEWLNVMYKQVLISMNALKEAYKEV